MSALAEAAREALANKRAEQAAAAAAIAESEARAGVKRTQASPLGQWFPNVQWEFVANCTGSLTIVREKDGLDLLFGFRVTKDGSVDQGPDEYEVAIYRDLGKNLLGQQFTVKKVLKAASDLGAYLEETTPQPAPADVPSFD